jgi:hypothetical protein
VLKTPIYQGLLFHFLITDFLCFGCFNRCDDIPGLGSILQVPPKQSKCQRALEASKAKYEELQRYLEAKNMPVPRVHTSSAKIIKFLFYLRHGGAWSRARLRLSRLK